MRDWEDYVRRRLPGLALEACREQRIVRELADQLEDFYLEARSRGLTEEDADADARRQVRDWASFAADIRRADRSNRQPRLERWEERAGEAGRGRKGVWSMMEHLIQDLRHSLRQWRHDPGFAMVATLTLALGIGGATAVFSLVNAILWAPLPYPGPDRLVRLWDSNEAAGLPHFSVSIANLFAWRDRNRVFEAIGAYREAEFAMGGPEGPQQVEGARVSHGLFAVLGVQPALGRTFSPEEDRPGGGDAVVLTHRLWQWRFGADPSILGGTLSLEGRPHTVVGVMPPGFEFPIREGVELMVPYRLADDPESRGSHFLRVLARMKPGVTLRAARDDMQRIAAELQEETPSTNEGFTVALLSLHEATVGSVQAPLLILFAAVGVMLLIAGVNIAGLLLARGAGRVREMSVRAALGASRGRIIRQLLTESLVLGLAGGMAGLLAAAQLTRLLVAWMPQDLPRLAAVRTDVWVSGFALAVSLLTVVLAGIAPGLSAARADLAEALAQSGRALSGGFAGHRMRSVLVVAEVACALVLLAAGALLLRSLLNLRRVDPGFDAKGALSARITPLEADYPSPEARSRFYREALERIAALAGVEAAGVVHRLPLTGNSVLPIFLEGQVARDESKPPKVNWRAVSPGYFRALGIPLLRGRLLTELETWERGGAALVNQTFAERFWPGGDALGRRFGPRPEGPWNEVVGIVADTRESSLTEPAEPAVYLPYVTAPVPAMTLAVRTAGKPLSLVSPIRAEIRLVNKAQPIGSFATLEDFLADLLAGPRLFASLIGGFGAIGLLLAVVGLYGLLSYTVSQRMHEFGIRAALGATPGSISRLVIRRGLRLVGIGILAGLGAAVASAQLLRSQLHGVQAVDPLTFAVVSLLLVVVALAAMTVPARRATRADPLAVLRCE